MNFIHIEEAKHLDGFKVWLKFNDGIEGVVNLKNSLGGPIFAPLKDIAYFKKFKIEGHTLTWENGADFAPEYLKEILEQSSNAA